MCPNFIYWILQVLKDPKVSKSLINQGLLACLFDSNCNSNRHAYHGVVTSADQAHHLVAVDALGELQSGMLFEKSYYIRLRELLNHKIICAEHIVCVFPENIIARFDVSVNDVSEEFAEKLRSNTRTNKYFKYLCGRSLCYYD